MKRQPKHQQGASAKSGQGKGFQWPHFAILVLTGLLVIAPLFYIDPPLAPASLDWTPRIAQPEVTTGRITPLTPASDALETGASPSMPSEDDDNTAFDHLIRAAAERHGVDPHLVKAIITVESGFDKRATGPKGARGLMQLMPQTARSLGVKNTFDPAGNIEAGAKHIRELLDRYKGNLKLALAAYNAGVGRVAQYRGIPPFRTTKAFIQSVLNHQRRYQAKQQQPPAPAGRVG